MTLEEVPVTRGLSIKWVGLAPALMAIATQIEHGGSEQAEVCTREANRP